VKDRCLDPAKTGAIVIDPALAGLMIKVNTPSTVADHAEIKLQFFRGEIVGQIRPIARIQMATCPTMFDTTPCSHTKSYYLYFC
jgi:hypothetical protein